uniref:Uncharacterized protein n=1 Tax=Arundo donax TaxID=35708 RepID=A0A0A9HNS5_ARUDO
MINTNYESYQQCSTARNSQKGQFKYVFLLRGFKSLAIPKIHREILLFQPSPLKYL